MAMKDLRYDLLPMPAKSILALFVGSTGKFSVLFTLACFLPPPFYYGTFTASGAPSKRRVKEIEKSRSSVKVVRNKNLSVGKKNQVICMELDPTFVKENA
eukprot:CAMPEP_0198280240 /NCGR_PEP_ID=MMETSP1449-20131203/356_1 /TAXON_ID=420275 /ORGANISM="Attheya septentrionalis, Strain CCMP2084" /LENGTH=99 /DNA_ID=CAMNT_0043975533 /DNA_START=10 /DNA_END=304 /DNA_ORIENTATION=+